MGTDAHGVALRDVNRVIGKMDENMKCQRFE